MDIMPNQLLQLTFTKDYKCFKQGDTFVINEGANLFVGEQGCGKSTLFGVLRSLGNGKKMDFVDVIVPKEEMILRSFDFEKDNVRTKDPRLMPDGSFGFAITARMMHSHGQIVNAMLKVVDEKDKKRKTLFLMDEPDMALSIRSCRKLAERIKKNVSEGTSFFLCCHNPIVISAFDEVYSLEHRKSMKSQEFIESHMKE